jgi:AcrR family transcriptional regulator
MCVHDNVDRRMPPSADATRRRLVDAAEALFAERGIDVVSLREITTAAGVRNSTALQYHFGDRDGLVRAVLRKHYAEVESRRHALLDDYEATPGAELRALTAAYVRPLASKLADPGGGRDYLRILGQLGSRPEAPAPREARADAPDSTNRWRGLVGERLPDIAVERLHRRWIAIRVTLVELARRAAAPPARDDRLFTSHLIDVVTAVLDAPVSAETAHLLGETAHPLGEGEGGRWGADGG